MSGAEWVRSLAAAIREGRVDSWSPPVAASEPARPSSLCPHHDRVLTLPCRYCEAAPIAKRCGGCRHRSADDIGRPFCMVHGPDFKEDCEIGGGR